jgi:hypothetical protein
MILLSKIAFPLTSPINDEIIFGGPAVQSSGDVLKYPGTA